MALRLLPARTRRSLLTIYTFARYVDDLGDEPEPGDDRSVVLARLDGVTADLDRVFAGERPRAVVLARLVTTVRDCSLPREPFDALVEANRLDQTVTDYRTRKQLLDYCHLSATPVGELVLHVFGYPADGSVRSASDDICCGLQLMEHWQDVGEDARRGRVYLPREDRERHGVTVEDLTGPRAPAHLRALLAEETAWARSLLDRGSWLLSGLSGAARWAIAGYIAGGMAAGAALARAGYDPLSAPDVRPRRVDVLTSACGLLAGRLPARLPSARRDEEKR